MVSEHNRRNFDSELLSDTFSVACFGNSLVAIAAGEVGQIAADAMDLQLLSGSVHYGGYCTPFDIAILFQVLAMVAIAMTWSENYGSKSSSSNDSGVQGLALAIRTISQDVEVLCCGIVCALFEASMFIFVFMWTPALTEEGADKPEYGHIFAAFMVMAMLGSQVFSLESERRPVEAIGKYTLVIAAACHAVPVLTNDTATRFLSFLVFEMCVGLYFPMMGTMKGRIVPEESRSAIYNLYRVPLNIIVVLALVAKVDMKVAFAINTCMLIVAAAVQLYLSSLRNRSQYRSVEKATMDVEFGLDDDDDPFSSTSTSLP
jgi:predicted MFS family arabinose efflux permease